MQANKLIFAFIISCCSFISGAIAQNTLTGIITEADTGIPIAGATIYFPDIKTGTSTDLNGRYFIDALPSRKLLIQITFIGYASVIEIIDIASVNQRDFILKESITEINEIVVTGNSQSAEAKRIATPVTIITKNNLLQTSSTNIIDALAEIPGISQITTGPAISKPQVRGLGYNRVVVIHDGIKQEGQQWGDEHGIEIDEYSINRIEILKGPASLIYGSDAMAGVIHFITAPTLPLGNIKMNILSNYQTNNGLTAYSGNMAGNVKGFIWDVRYTGKNAHAYKNVYDGYVYGSGFKEYSTSGIIGINRKWGYSHLHASLYSLDVGLIEGERDSISGNFVRPVAEEGDSTSIEIVPTDDFKSYEIPVPKQNIGHYKFALNTALILGKGTLKTIIGWQQNNRKEFADIIDPSAYELFFSMQTINYDIKYEFENRFKWITNIGVNGMYQNSRNKGEEVLIPEYNLFDFGFFVTTKRNFNKLDLGVGIRYDIRNLNSLPYSTLEEGSIFNSFQRNFSSFSGSIGATYQFNEVAYSKLNLSRGFRVPNIAELGSNGIHEGTFRFETGDNNLKPETSFQTDIAFGINSEHISFEATFFNNAINNFIYLVKLPSQAGGDSLIVNDGEEFLAFTYTQGRANLFGAEFIVDIHPHPVHWLHFENSFSFVNAELLNATDSTRYLPFSPAPKLITSLRADIDKIKEHVDNVYVQFQAENYFGQKHVYSAYNTETNTPAYTILNFGAGTDIMSKNKILFSVYLSINNIADVGYQSHLSRLKYAPFNYATGRNGVYEMGRNFSIKLNVPLTLKS